MTRIFFDAKGKPSWQKVDTAQYMRTVQRTECKFTDSDNQWFRKPLERSDG